MILTTQDAIRDAMSSILADYQVKFDEFDEITEQEFQLVEAFAALALSEIFSYIQEYKEAPGGETGGDDSKGVL